MANITKYGSTKRFGARYGRTLKEKLGKIEAEKRNSKTCPFCLKKKVSRIAAGIWFCKKCNRKFTGGAYSLKSGVKAEEGE